LLRVHLHKQVAKRKLSGQSDARHAGSVLKRDTQPAQGTYVGESAWNSHLLAFCGGSRRWRASAGLMGRQMPGEGL